LKERTKTFNTLGIDLSTTWENSISNFNYGNNDLSYKQNYCDKLTNEKFDTIPKPGTSTNSQKLIATVEGTACD